MSGESMTVIEWVRTLDIAGAALLVLWLGYTQKWFWKHQVDEIKKDRDYWRETAIAMSDIAGKVAAAKRAAAR